jgi:hypothetical protein
MKKNTLIVLFLVLCFAPWACQQPIAMSPAVPPVVPTATPDTTPVCGFSVVSLGTSSLSAGPSIIRSLADWQTFCSYGTGTIPLGPTPTPTPPPPPVDFSSQMLILMVSPVCASSTLQVTSVCEGPSTITVTANNVQACAICNMAANWGYFSALAVPQSSLPVTWVLTQVPCQWAATPTPTP